MGQSDLMAKIIIDGQEVECRDGISVLQAGLDAGWDIPHYCYHPGLSVVASCRLCLMEMKMPHPKTREMVWSPKLVPSCQTPARDGLEVRFDTERVKDNQRKCMEFFLLNHPLDCPVCDQAGECHLQDYSEKFGSATGRMVEQKHKNPKKDIGSKTLLYADRCVHCGRCIRFCDEVAGTSELCLVNRGSRQEVDVFPGKPLENPIQGNVVDVCPVGSLLDKDFLMKQRVWLLSGASSICPGCAAGCAIRIDHNDGRIRRLKPRYNPGVNDWWMCDEGRFGWKYVHGSDRLDRLVLRRGAAREYPDWAALPQLVRSRFEQVSNRDGAGKVAAVLSPFMSCEEAWLLAGFIREVAPDATLVAGHVPTTGEDQKFPSGCDGDGKFTIRAEKCPNKRGIEIVLAAAGGSGKTFEEFIAAAGDGAFSAAWIVGGYPDAWVKKEWAAAIGRIGTVVAQDILPNPIVEAAAIVVPSCAWAERSGCFVNCGGRVQAFDAAIRLPQGCQRDGQYLGALAGRQGLYNAVEVRRQMAKTMPEFGELHVPPQSPKHAH